MTVQVCCPFFKWEKTHILHCLMHIFYQYLASFMFSVFVSCVKNLCLLQDHEDILLYFLCIVTTVIYKLYFCIWCEVEVRLHFFPTWIYSYLGIIFGAKHTHFPFPHRIAGGVFVRNQVIA